jgi:hypothetical protein
MQGMNELIAPIVFCVWNDSNYVLKAKDLLKEQTISPDFPFPSIFPSLGISAYDLLSFLCSPEGSEADSYSLFCALMKVAGDWFDAQFVAEGSYTDISVLAKAQAVLLRVSVKDNELFRHLKRIRLDPPIYLMCSVLSFLSFLSFLLFPSFLRFPFFLFLLLP